MTFAEYGDPSGQLVVYFHGAPGAVEECAVFDRSAKKVGLRFVCFERFSLDSNFSGEEYIQAIASSIREQAGEQRFAVVGFSIGCHVALQVSALLGEQVRSLHLVSAAGPLESGDYLNDMAGGVVFKLAKSSPLVFAALSLWQSLLCRVSPRLLYSMIFGSAKGQDKALSQDAEFQAFIYKILRRSYVEQLGGYKRDVMAYVKPWGGLLGACQGKAHLWHGTEDNWSPIAMSEHLAEALPQGGQLHRVDGASHYSCLKGSAVAICQSLRESRRKGGH